jgi:hypothetical protein
MVVDGRAGFVGSDGASARRALETAATLPHGRVDITAADGPPETSSLRVTVAASGLPPISRGDRADIVVALTEDGVESKVTRGENHGRTLKHSAAVRRLQVAGLAAPDGGRLTADLRLDESWRRDRLKIVAFVQERRSRAVLASAAVPVPPR